MTKYSIIIAKRFIDELGAILDFIALSNPNQAMKFSNEIYAKIATLSSTVQGGIKLRMIKSARYDF